MFTHSSKHMLSCVWILIRHDVFYLVQPCEIKPCKNNGVCVNKKGGNFTCKCTKGFGGTFCDKRGLFQLVNGSLNNNSNDGEYSMHASSHYPKVWKVKALPKVVGYFFMGTTVSYYPPIQEKFVVG
jgi:hypothetical protein